MRTVLISIPLGRYCRVLTLSGVGGLLAQERDTRLVILSPAAHLEEFRKSVGLSENVTFEDLPNYEPSTTLIQRLLRKMLAKSQQHRNIFLPLMRLYEKAQAAQEPRRFDEIFRRYSPSLVVTASPGFNSSRDIPLIREAQRAGIPTLCVIYGWDNLNVAIKGSMPTRPQTLAVWNDLMKREAVEIHHYDPEDVRVVGPPHFDLYQDKGIFLSREKFAGRLGLNPKKKLVLFAVGTLKYTDNAFIMDILSRAMQNGGLAQPCQVVCRRHPLSKGKDRNIYERFSGCSDVKFDDMTRYLERIDWTPDREEVIHLANLIYHSDVIVNIASTIALEAAILDRPVINVGFNPLEPARFEETVVKRGFLQHYRYVLEREGSTLVKSEAELVQSLNEYLLNPALKREGRARLAHDLCYRLDGKASDRVASLILELSSPRS